MARPPEMADEQPEMAIEEVEASTTNRIEVPQQETISHRQTLRTENGIHSPGAATLSSNLSDNGLDESSHRSPRRRSKAHKQRATDDDDGDDRPMGHYPPRDSHPESRQESPPTAFVDTHAQSQLSESWHQFQEHVGKPSKEALHKFFYPPGNSHHSPRRRSNKAHHMSERDRERLKERTNVQNQTNNEGLDFQEENERPNDAPLVDSGHGPSADGPTVQVQPQPQSTSAQQSATPHSYPADSILRTTSSGHPSVVESVGQPFSFQTSPSPPVSRDFQHSFDQEEEQDRKYVEGFWRVYDDLIMLSLFTQVGVVARLAASTWFTFFDGVFRHDSPLFTNLPLNCLSCFLLGFMGSGDRLMEMVTTRFTPRHLQQSIVQGGGEGDEEPCDDDLYYDGEGSDDKDGRGRGDGGLRQRCNRRPKRAKTNEHFHSWQPPLHWHDDLREVQLLALERRIRASKCLVLFPVMKEDADVMEHYFGEGYKASAEKEQWARQVQRRNTATRRRRRRFGRQKYCATNLADSDESRFLEHSGHESSSFSEFDNDDQDFGGVGLENPRSGDESDDDQGRYVDDGRFRFDLELTESTRKPASKAASSGAVDGDADAAAKADGDANNTAGPAASLPPSVQKLIKRAPGRTTNDGPTPVVALSASSTQQYASAGESHSIEPHQMQGPQPINNLTSSPQTALAANQAQAESAIESGVQMVNLGLGTPTYAGTPQSQSTNTTNQSYPLNQSLQEADGGQEVDPQLEHIISNVQARVSENISRIGRVNLADGWDVGTTPEAMADDLMLGLRDGFCGALSSFSSWNSSMLNLLKEGHIGEALVGYMLGIQLPIVAYRFGQQSAVYFFVWRCRRETKRAERMGGYGIRVRMDDDDDDDDDNNVERNPSGSVGDSFEDELSRARSAETPLDDESLSPEIPSVRAICTALYLLSLVTQCTSLSFFSDPEDQQIALSLLFSPFGTLTRWRLSRFNSWHPGFPLGTFTCNIVACALGGSLGSLLAGNPGPKERILLQSLIAGFGGTLSSLATFIVEILAGMDPLLFRFDGLIYCGSSLFWALIVGFVFSASVDWADETT